MRCPPKRVKSNVSTTISDDFAIELRILARQCGPLRRTVDPPDCIEDVRYEVHERRSAVVDRYMPRSLVVFRGAAHRVGLAGMPSVQRLRPNSLRHLGSSGCANVEAVLQDPSHRL